MQCVLTPFAQLLTLQMLLSETKAIESDLRRTAVDRTIIMQNQADSYIRGESD